MNATKPSSDKPAEILIVAAEASSELYATRILEECQRRNLNINFFGIGSREMQERGCELIESSEKMAVVGILEVLSHWSIISSAFKNLVKAAAVRRPRMALLLDYPDFNLRLAKKLKTLQIPVFYYISPQVWAWRTGRINLIRKVIDKMLVVFPFEVDFYKTHGVSVSFVGHPLLDEPTLSTEDTRKTKREKLGIKPGEFLVGLLPGSRKSELENNFASQLRAAEILSDRFPKAKFVILVAPSLETNTVKSYIPQDLKFNYSLVKDNPSEILSACDACVVASGTATLMTALAETPMVIMYKMNPLTALLARRLVRGKFFGMPNLVSDKQIVPELFQEKASAENLAYEISRYITDQNYFEKTKSHLKEIKSKLGTSGASRRVTDEIAQLFGDLGT